MLTPPDPAPGTVVPPRSVLWGRAPRGLGTGLVSSLPGHLNSMAAEYGIPPVELLHWIAQAASFPGVAGRERGDYEAMWADLLRKPRASLSGLTRTAEIVVDAVNRLTGRTDTGATTTLPWALVIPTKGAFRRERAYCPCCYEEWGRPPSATERRGGDRPSDIYEPLLWQFEPLTTCVTHGVRLRSACPNPGCGASRGALAAWAQAGYCGRCGTSLGEPWAAVIAREGELEAGEVEWAAFVTEALTDLLTNPPDSGEDVSPRTLPAAVQIAVGRTFDGTYTPFAAGIGKSLGTVSLWKDGRRRPSLPGALRICAVAGFRLPDFLAGRLDALRAAPLPAQVPPIPPSDETHIIHDPADVVSTLNRALRADLPPSLAAVNRSLHVGDRQLMREYPGQCTEIVERHRAWVEDRSIAAQAERQRLVLAAITDVQVRGDYPSRHQVQRLLPTNVSLRDPRLGRLWKDELVRLGWPRPDKPRRVPRLG